MLPKKIFSRGHLSIEMADGPLNVKQLTSYALNANFIQNYGIFIDSLTEQIDSFPLFTFFS